MHVKKTKLDQVEVSAKIQILVVRSG